jgi:2-polyprenyl-6-methoxyphenol hydroxylase-like FAD-dependent oxidoreductase
MTQSILIVGAGTTGLTAAVELARNGLRPVVIEKRKGPSHLSRAVGILPRSLEILQPSGVADAILAEAIAFTGIAFHVGTRRIASLALNFDAASRIWGLPQDRTEAHLSDALQRYGGHVQYDTAFDGLAQDAGGVTVRYGGTETRFDHVIGADGVHSPVRAALGMEFPGYDLPGLWSIADVDSPGWRDPAMFQGFILPKGEVVVVVPLDKQRFRVISSLPDAMAALPVPMPVSNLRNAGAFTISIRQVSQYQSGRVYLAGDAAHCHSPIGGRGMNLGIADAADLVGRLMAGDTAAYTAARHAEGAHVLAFSERGRRAIQSTNPMAQMIVRSVMRLASAIPPLGRVVMRQMASG